MVQLLAFSLQDQVEKYGAYIGIAAFFGLAVLTILYFSQARELRRLRDWAGRAPERAQEVEARAIAQAEAARRDQVAPAARPPAAATAAAEAPAAAQGEQATQVTEPVADPGQSGNGRPPTVGVPSEDEDDHEAAGAGPEDEREAGPAEPGPETTPGDAEQEAVPAAATRGEAATGAVAAGGAGTAPQDRDTAAVPPGGAPAEPAPAEASPAAGDREAGAASPAAATGSTAQDREAAAVGPDATGDAPPDAGGQKPEDAAGDARDRNPGEAAPAAGDRKPGEAAPDAGDQEAGDAAGPPTGRSADGPETGEAPVPRATPLPRRAPAPAAAPLRQPSRSATLPPRRPAPGAAPRQGSGLSSRIAVIGVGLGVIVVAAVALFATGVIGGGDDPAPAPNTASSPPAGQAPAPAELTPATTKVSVLNGTTTAGLASGAADTLQEEGYAAENVTTGNNTDQQRADSSVLYGTRPGSRVQARSVAQLLEIQATERLDADTRDLSENADVVVILGQDKAP